jgi:transcriptional regulator GlxA family with amidase domain
MFARPGLTLLELAGALGVTAHRLSELLNDDIGMSFYDYVDSFRVAEASTLLLQRSDISVVQVGYRCGYRAKATFYRRFTTAFGVPPGKYRRRRQG